MRVAGARMGGRHIGLGRATEVVTVADAITCLG